MILRWSAGDTSFSCSFVLFDLHWFHGTFFIRTYLPRDIGFWGYGQPARDGTSVGDSNLCSRRCSHPHTRFFRYSFLVQRRERLNMARWVSIKCSNTWCKTYIVFFLLLRLGVIVLPRVGDEFMLVRVYRSRKLVSFDVFFSMNFY